MLECDLVTHRSVPYPDRLRDRIAAVLPPASTNIGEVCELDVAIGQFFGEVAYDLAKQVGESPCSSCAPTGRPSFTGWRATTRRHAPVGSACLDRRGDRGDRRERRTQPRHRCGRARGTARERARRPTARRTSRDCPGRAEPRGDCQRDRARVRERAGRVRHRSGERAHGRRRDVVQPGSGTLRRGRSARGAAGRSTTGLLASLLDEPYYVLAPPKSTGKELFNLSYVEAALGGRELELDDLVATLSVLTAETVARALIGCGVTEVVAAGGGTRNRVLMSKLRERLSGVAFRPLEDFGVPEACKEALAFALDRLPDRFRAQGFSTFLHRCARCEHSRVHHPR